MKKTIFPLLFLILSVQLHAQEEFNLRLQKGATYCLSTTNKTTISELNGGQEVSTLNFEKGSFCYKILEDLDSLYLVETIFTHLSQEVKSAQDSGFYSSDHPKEGDVLSTIFSRILNKPFLVWMRKDYTWKETKGLDSIFIRSYDDYKLPPATKSYLDSIMLVMVLDFTRNDADLSAVLYNKKKVVPGSVWTTSEYSEHVVPTYDSCTYYFAESGDLLTLTGTGVIRSTNEELKDGDEVSSYDLTGKSGVTVVFYKLNNWIKQGSIKSELNGKAISRNTKTRKSQEIPMKITTEIMIEGFMR